MFGVVLYIGLVIETLYSRTLKFLSHVKKAELATNIVNGLRSRPPKITFSIQNYHKNGKSKILTHKADEPYLFFEWLDTSPDAAVVEYVKL